METLGKFPAIRIKEQKTMASAFVNTYAMLFFCNKKASPHDWTYVIGQLAGDYFNKFLIF